MMLPVMLCCLPSLILQICCDRATLLGTPIGSVGLINSILVSKVDKLKIPYSSNKIFVVQKFRETAENHMNVNFSFTNTLPPLHKPKMKLMNCRPFILPYCKYHKN